MPFPEISREIFSIDLFGVEFALRWYALSYLAGVFLGWRLALRFILKPNAWANKTAPMTPEQLFDFMLWMMLGIVIGGRLGFIAAYAPGMVLDNPVGIFTVWHGGMSFHGGLLGVVTATLLFCRVNRVRLLPSLDLLAIAAPVGLFLGRLANFFNNELWGRPTDLPWGVVFPGHAAQSCPGFTGLPGTCARHPSQLYEAGLEGLVLGILILVLAQRGALKRPGLLMSVFAIGYGLARILIEFVRQPDAQFITSLNPGGHATEFFGFGITMGQFLSVPVLLVGLAVFLRTTATPSPQTKDKEKPDELESVH